MTQNYYILKKARVRHAVKQGEKETLCNEPMRRGERGRDIFFYSQVSCPICRKGFALALDKFNHEQDKRVGV